MKYLPVFATMTSVYLCQPALVLAGIRLVFFIVALIVLGFGFVMKNGVDNTPMV